jgi:hypothetical protein
VAPARRLGIGPDHVRAALLLRAVRRDVIERTGVIAPKYN